MTKPLPPADSTVLDMTTPTRLRSRAPKPDPWERADWLARADTLRRWAADARSWATKPGAIRSSPLRSTATAAALRSAALSLTAAAEAIDLVTRADPMGASTPPRTR